MNGQGSATLSRSKMRGCRTNDALRRRVSKKARAPRTLPSSTAEPLRAAPDSAPLSEVPGLDSGGPAAHMIP